MTKMLVMLITWNRSPGTSVSEAIAFNDAHTDSAIVTSGRSASRGER